MLALPKVSIQKKNKWSHCFAHSSKITGLFSLFLLQAFLLYRAATNPSLRRIFLFLLKILHNPFWQKPFFILLLEKISFGFCEKNLIWNKKKIYFGMFWTHLWNVWKVNMAADWSFIIYIVKKETCFGKMNVLAIF